jgi:gliding motility-associated-like protein
MPNTFTPNGDGENDLAIPQIPCANITHHFEFNIYNRWGEKLYTTFNLNEGWNGVYHGILQPQETYIYSIQYYIGNKKVKELLKGNISLLR